MQVCILGAGIAGLAAAYTLARAGHAVTVVDRGTPGLGASAGNGGQLSYAYVQPLADPGLWTQLPALLLAPGSPLTWRPQASVAHWRWMAAFLAACTPRRSAATTRALLALAATSRAAFDAMRAHESLACDYTEPGKLVLLRTPGAVAGARRQLALQRALGGPPQVLVSPAEACAIEPALAHDPGPLLAAVHTPGEAAADCLQVCAGLARVLRRQGVRVVDGDVRGFVRQGDRLQAARCAGGEEIVADAFVLAAGSGSAALAAQLGVYLPVQPLKGYSITVPLAPGAPAPRVSITDSARKVVFARLGQRLRVAGMVEVVGEDRRVRPARIDALRGAVAAVFPGCLPAQGDMEALQPWAGLRPATPTGLPLVGRHPGAPRNLLLHTGHGALGFTLAFGTASQLPGEVKALPATQQQQAPSAARTPRRAPAARPG